MAACVEVVADDVRQRRRRVEQRAVGVGFRGGHGATEVLPIIDRVRAGARLPNSLAWSALMRLIIASAEYEPSCLQDTSRREEVSAPDRPDRTGR